MTRIPDVTHFVDGGLISNFPINVFLTQKWNNHDCPPSVSGSTTVARVCLNKHISRSGNLRAMIGTLRSHYSGIFIEKCRLQPNRRQHRRTRYQLAEFQYFRQGKIANCSAGALKRQRVSCSGPMRNPEEEGLESTGGGGWAPEVYKVCPAGNEEDAG